MSSRKKLVVVGGGAAGFFCAIHAAQCNPNLQITIVEKTNKLLSKVKVSGGGRCNITHNEFDTEILSRNYPRGQQFLRKAFYRFNTQHTIDWFASMGISMHTEADGRMFPTSNNSQTIIDCFLRLAADLHISIATQTNIERIALITNGFLLHTQNGAVLQADMLCICTGGYPKLEQYHWLQFDEAISINKPFPSLFTFNMPKHSITTLMGVAVKEVEIKIRKTKYACTGPLMITHWGLSGPAVLKLSSFAALDLANMNYQFVISVNWVPQYNQNNLQQQWKSITALANQTAGNHNPLALPARLWLYLLEQSGIDALKRWSNISAAQQNTLIRLLTDFECSISGKTTFKEEFVTAGGVATSQIDHTTMEHKKIPNLFFAGEVLDVDGITGGFNFQNAWTTAFIAATEIARRS